MNRLTKGTSENKIVFKTQKKYLKFIIKISNKRQLKWVKH